MNHRVVMWMPTTKPVPTMERRRRETSIWVYEVPKAKAKHGRAMAIITTLNVLLGPNLSESMPMTTRPGTVRATLQMARSFNCCMVRPVSFTMVVTRGAMLNHTKKVRKKANHVLCSARMSSRFRSNRSPHPILFPDWP